MKMPVAKNTERAFAQTGFRFVAYNIIIFISFMGLLVLLIERVVIPEQIKIAENRAVQLSTEIQAVYPYLSTKELQNFVSKTAETDKQISFITVLDKNYKAVAHSTPTRIGMQFLYGQAGKTLKNGQRIIGNYIRDQDNPNSPYYKEHVIEISTPLFGENAQLEAALSVGVSLAKLNHQHLLYRLIMLLGSILFIAAFMIIVRLRNREMQAEVKKLIDSENRYKALFSNSLNPLVLLDQNLLILMANSKFETISGFTAEQLENKKNYRDFVPASEALAQLAAIPVNNNAEHESFETKFMKNDGSLTEVIMVAGTIPGTGSMLVETVDITEKNKIQEELRLSQERYRSLINNAAEGITVIQNERLVFVNKAFAEMTGYSEEELSSFPVHKILYQEDKESVLKVYHKRLNGAAVQKSHDFRLVKADSSLLWIRCNGVKIEWNGEPASLAFHTDITVQKKIELEREHLMVILQEKNEKMELLQYAIENASDSVFWVNMDCKIIYANKSACNSLGFSKEDMHSMYIQDIDPVFDMAHWMEFKKTLVPDKSNLFETFHKRKDSSIFPVEVLSTYIKRPNAEFVLAFSRDISDRKAAQEAIKTSEELFRIVTEQTGQLIYDYDLETGKIKWAGAIEPITGYTPEEYASFGYAEWRKYVHPDDIDSIEMTIIEARSNPGMMYKAEYRFMKKDHSYIFIEACGIFNNQSRGVFNRMIGTMTNITERKLAQQALKESEERLRTLINAMPDIVCFKDAEGRWLVANEFILKLFELEGINYVGKNDAELSEYSKFYSDAFNFCAQTDALAWQSGGQIREDEIIPTPGGRPYIFDIIKVPTFNKNHSKKAILIIGRDITERRAAEAEREKLLDEISQKNKELEDIVYVASHDLRSPLVNIQGFSQRLEKTCAVLLRSIEEAALPEATANKINTILKEQLPSALHFIKTSGIKMDTLINGLLRLSRTGRSPLTIENINMDQLLSVILATMTYQIQRNKVSVTVDPLPSCMGDSPQINQVFSNLIDNAIKYRAPERNLKIKISGSVNNNMVIYCVEDNGLGIAPEYHEKIWQLFNRLNPQGPIAGEGLGLTLVKRIVERHEGEVRVESESGIGSRFYVSFPVSKS